MQKKFIGEDHEGFWAVYAARIPVARLQGIKNDKRWFYINNNKNVMIYNWILGFIWNTSPISHKKYPINIFISEWWTPRYKKTSSVFRSSILYISVCFLGQFFTLATLSGLYCIMIQKLLKGYEEEELKMIKSYPKNESTQINTLRQFTAVSYQQHQFLL